jgi:hypothetical protein
MYEAYTLSAWSRLAGKAVSRAHAVRDREGGPLVRGVTTAAPARSAPLVFGNITAAQLSLKMQRAIVAARQTVSRLTTARLGVAPVRCMSGGA